MAATELSFAQLLATFIALGALCGRPSDRTGSPEGPSLQEAIMAELRWFLEEHARWIVSG